MKDYLKCFLITFFYIILFLIICFFYKYIDGILFSYIPFAYAIKWIFYFLLSSLYFVTIYAVFVATLSTYKNSLKTKWKFLYKYLIGWIGILCVSLLLFFYNNIIVIKVNKDFYKIQRTVRNASSEKEFIETYFNLDEYMTNIPSIMQYHELMMREDSINVLLNESYLSCEELLSQLPDSISRPTYEKYNLSVFGISYKYSNNIDISGADLYEITLEMEYTCSFIDDLKKQRDKYLAVKRGRIIKSYYLSIAYFLAVIIVYFLQFPLFKSKRKKQLKGSQDS